MHAIGFHGRFFRFFSGSRYFDWEELRLSLHALHLRAKQVVDCFFPE